MRIAAFRCIGIAFLIALACASASGAQSARSALLVPTPRDEAWLAEHEMHKRKAASGRFDIVFMGDSITERWRYPAEGKPV